MAVGYTDVPQQWTSEETSTGLAWCAQRRHQQDAMLGRHTARQERKWSRGGWGQRKGKGVTLLGGLVLCGFGWVAEKGAAAVSGCYASVVCFFCWRGGCQRAGWGAMQEGLRVIPCKCFRAAGRSLVALATQQLLAGAMTCTRPRRSSQAAAVLNSCWLLSSAALSCGAPTSCTRPARPPAPPGPEPWHCRGRRRRTPRQTPACAPAPGATACAGP